MVRKRSHHGGLKTGTPGISDGHTAPVVKATPADRIRQILTLKMAPVTLSALRDSCGIRTATLCETLKELLDGGTIKRTQEGYALN